MVINRYRGTDVNLTLLVDGIGNIFGTEVNTID
jgi:hypothetical protein